MQSFSLYRWVLTALFCLLIGLFGAFPAGAKPARTVDDWVAAGNAQLAQGRIAAALAIFGEVAARYPGYGPARGGVQRGLARFGPPGQGEAFLRYALAQDPARQKAFLAAWQILDQAHPLRFSASASILPSSNIQHVASERFFVTDLGTFQITNGGQEAAGVGLSYGASVNWIIHPRPNYRFVFRAAYTGAWFNLASLRYGEPSLALRYEHLGGRAPWSLEWFTSQRRYGGTAADVTSDNKAQGLTLSGNWRRGASVILWQLGGDYRDYSEKPYFTGPSYNLGLEVRTPLGDERRVSYGLRLTRGLPRTDYHRYIGAELHVGYERPLFEGLRGGISLAVEERRYDTAFPLMGKPRRDRSLSLGLNAKLTRIRIFGQVPSLGCTFSKTRSNVALYSSNSVDCAMALNLAF